MGNSCSSGQAHKDKDNVSQRSEESPSYQLTVKKPSTDGQPAEQNAPSQHPSPSADSERDTLAAQSSFRGKPAQGHAKLLKGVASTSISDSMSVSSSACAQSPACPVGPPLQPVDAALELPGCASTLPASIRRLLLGREDAVTTRRRSVITVYVCAADSQDCCVEKGVLHSSVAPALRKAARRKGWRLHVTDLHWRSPLEQQRHHGFPMLCTAELKRQSEYAVIIPVLFLNSSLGTSLLPLTVESLDFRTALAAAATEADRQLLNKWYKSEENKNDPPCYRLVRSSGSATGPESAVGALSVLVRALTLEARDVYLTTVVEQEVHNTVLMCTETAKRCVWISRIGAMLGGPPASAGAGDSAPDPLAEQELQRRLHNLQRDLKTHLSDKNIVRCTHRGDRAEYLHTVQEQLSQKLLACLDALTLDESSLNQYGPAAGIPASFLEELKEQYNFVREVAQCAAFRNDILADINSYVCSDEAVGPLTLCGPAGSGKTCLAARVATLATTWLPDAALIVRFIGVGEQTGSSRSLLKSLVDHLSILANGGVYRKKQDLKSLNSQLNELLSLVSQHRPLVLVISAVDKLDSLEWLPKVLPENVKLIVTCKQDVCNGWLTSTMVPVHPLTVGEARNAVRACTQQFGHYGTVTPPPDTTKLVEVLGDMVPLHSKVLAWQSVLPSEWCWESKEASWSADETNPVAPLRVCTSLNDQVSRMLDSLECALGMERARECLTIISVSRRGVSDDEMLDLLARDEAFNSKHTYLPWAPAALVWVQLATLLSHFLRWDSVGLVRERDTAFHTAIVNRYWAKHEIVTRRKFVDYFEGRWYEDNIPSMSGRLVSQENKFSNEYYNQRKLEELPYQYFFLYKDDLITYANLPFFIEIGQIHDRLAATSCTQFLEDLDRIKMPNIPEHIVILKQFLEERTYAIDYDCRQIYSLFGAFLSKRPVTSSICLQWKESCGVPPVPSLIALNMASLERNLGRTGSSYDLVVRLEGCDNYVAALSTDREEISVWDIISCKKVRTLLGVTQPINLVPIDQFKCVVLCRRELRVYDLDKGTFLTTLKGVMNQKMPFYGLHDKSHLVCLSRNRMYVNLMNTDTGDCVTTFKAGEDRFLNSLLVSGDGRVLVCGDETQKPFPLLVWSLTSRKLLYDLRIPHHDFLTSLSAITHEGSYVCVVARELDDEPAPNFIVVYDLQSGTLFKKWKPGADTTAIAITSAAGCVAAALADTRILVWDLVTGNCRCSLRGHSAPATQLRLSARGALLLSRDDHSLPCDPSVRIWDLNAGKVVAVYTPPSPVMSCELLGEGRMIALALQDRDNLLTLKLIDAAVTTLSSDEKTVYGNAQNEGKVFDLREGDKT